MKGRRGPAPKRAGPVPQEHRGRALTTVQCTQAAAQAVKRTEYQARLAGEKPLARQVNSLVSVVAIIL
jgi:hypothetical protein